MATISRLERQYGGFSGRAADLVARFRSGKLTAAEQRAFVNMSEGEFVNMFANDQTGLTSNEVSTAMRNKAANEEELNNNPAINRQVRGMQWEEVRRNMLGTEGGAFTIAAASQLGKLGINDDGTLAAGISGAMADRLRVMDKTVLGDSTKRAVAGGAAIKEYLQKESAKNPGGNAARLLNRLESMSPEQQHRELSIMAGSMWDMAEQGLVESGGEKYLINVLRANDPVLQAKADQVRAKGEVASDLQSMARGRGGSMSQRFLNAIQAGSVDGSDMSLTRAVGEALGMETNADHVKEVTRMVKRISSLEASGATTAAQKDELKRARQEMLHYMESQGLMPALDEAAEEGAALTEAAASGELAAGTPSTMEIGSITIKSDNIEVKVDGRSVGTVDSVAKSDRRGGSEVVT